MQTTIFKTIPCARVKLIRDGDCTVLTDTIKRPEDSYHILNTLIGDDDREHLIALFLDTRHRVICTHTLSVGTANATICSQRELFRAALLSGAVAIILGHNHPSGDPTPSAADISITRDIKRAGDLLDIQLLDHVVIGHNRNTSLKSLGHL